jgi:hypothetical protein
LEGNFIQQRQMAESDGDVVQRNQRHHLNVPRPFQERIIRELVR